MPERLLFYKEHFSEQVAGQNLEKNSCCLKVEDICKTKLTAERAAYEQEKQEIWEGRLWFEQQYENLLQSRTYLLGYYLTQVFRLHKPAYHLYQLALLPLPVRFKKRLQEPSFYVGILRRVWARMVALATAFAAEYRKRSIKPIEIKQQPWAGPLVSCDRYLL